MPTMEFSVSTRVIGDCVILDLVGDINAFAEQALNRAYGEAEEQHPKVVLLNFHDVGYINSTGIALLVGLMARSRKVKRELAVYGLNDHYREIFSITRMSDFLQIYPDEKSALAMQKD